MSNVLADEIKTEQARDFLANLPKSQVGRIESTDESDALAKQYIAEKVITENHWNDCRHVALSTIYADGIVSWNMKDMVKREKRYNSVNVAQGYPETKIVTPNNFEEIHNGK